MIRSVLRLVFLVFSVWVVDALFADIRADTLQALFIAALVLGLLNTFIKPLLMLFSLPFIILTLGFFLILINALLLKMVGWIVPGFHVDGWWATIGGSVIISLLGLFFGIDDKRRAKNQQTQNENHPPPSREKIDNDKIIDV
ncbi:MAG: phage holin family protein [Verrucomicrobiota bacterium]|nr:phage holin family protein [Verrucomicrobiota bacterium]